MDWAKLRAWWSKRQGLEGDSRNASAAIVLDRSGWARSVAGAGPYLTLFSRGGISRSNADAAVLRLEIHELPAARGCTYVVPKSEFSLALLAGQNFTDGEVALARKLGVTDREIETLCNAVVKATGSKPRMPDEIRESVRGAVRSLGEAGKKKGMNTTLPLALGLLQARGEIRRVPDNGRLDQQRYGYIRWIPNPLMGNRTPQEEVFTELAKRFFGWIGPARLADFQWFSGLGARAAKNAAAPLNLKSAVAGDEEWLLLPQDAEAFATFRPPSGHRYVLVSSLDAIAALRRDAKPLLDTERDTKKLEKTIGSLTSFSDLSHHAILDHGKIVGFWEFDPEAGKIVWAASVPANAELRKAIGETEEYVLGDLGDARSFSLDSVKARQPRLAALRAAAK